MVFTDYGNSAFVGEGEFLAGAEDIPAGEEKDVYLVEPTIGNEYEENNVVGGEIIEEFVEEQFVKLEYAEESRALNEVKAAQKLEVEHIADAVVKASPGSHLVELEVGDFCVARFSEDNVW